ncbi:hypothetical protein DRE_00022 [Drechslerella stenobrocha 248]|uniref:ADP-ribosylhydrolase ARH3 n=1 Tax=Drechslerella stenobrocha 248 TaxID=1043628 RepID=W7I9G3_9PEZI|nr:hypothetical protein DRE_00022 [Drechslerella stenobrocha 248]
MTAPSVTLESRIKGAIFGVAVADALGGPVEFQRRGSFSPVTDYEANMNFGLPPGAWTDDTSMTLCLAQSLIAARAFDPVSQLQNYIAWQSRGYLSSVDRCFDIGNLTRITLSFWSRHIPPKPNSSTTTASTPTAAAAPTAEALASLQQDLNRSYKRSAFCGNGSLMRTVPIGLFFHSSPPSTIAAHAHAASELTHPHPANGEACAVYSILVASILSPPSPSSATTTIDKPALFAIFKSFVFTEDSLRTRFAPYSSIEDFSTRSVDQISSSGYVVHSLEAALWAFFTTDDWATGCLKVVNLGDDADTVAAIYGGLAGAYYGLEAIPARWRDGLLKSNVVAEIANDLSRVIVG